MDEQALLALQVPKAIQALSRLVADVDDFVFMQAGSFRWRDHDLWISRSGYTGEDGFRSSLPAEAITAFADELCALEEVKPIGLGARDSLPDRHIDGDLRLTRPATERRRDVEAHRPEIGVIARADTGTEAQVGEGRGRAAIDLARIEEADHPEIAEAIARLDRRFVDAAAADGIEIEIGRAHV